MRRLRMASPSSVSASPESLLIGELVNQAKHDCENAWPWLELRTVLGVVTVSGTVAYSLTDFGERYKIDRVYCHTNKADIYQGNYVSFDERTALQNVLSGWPDEWRVSGVDSNGDPKIELHPTPDDTYTVQVYATVAQAALSADSDVLQIPSLPVVLGAYALAIKERGDNGGTTMDSAERAYRMALQDAIAQDNLAAGRKASDWEVV